MMKKLCYVEPTLSRYSLTSIMEMADHVDVDVVYSPIDRAKGFGAVIEFPHPHLRYIKVPTYQPFGEKVGQYQAGLLTVFRKSKADAIILSCNPRYISLWLSLIWARLLGIKVYLHGHGLHKKMPAPRLVNRLIYWALLRLTNGYICYTESVLQSLSGRCAPEKLTIADNSITVEKQIPPAEKTGAEKGILFLGRLRTGCGLELLIHAVQELREKHGIDLEIFALGGGERDSEFHAYKRPWLHLYGEVYDHAKIAEISRACLIGAYPGDVGLSLVHYMALSLPPLIHDCLPRNNPEACYLKDGINGFSFSYSGGQAALTRRLLEIVTMDPAKFAAIRETCFSDFQDLVSPPMSVRMLKAARLL
jgi:glycosyltransferase involved in cell wall biosynthesis